MKKWDLREVRLYYPSGWPLVLKTEPFNWFLCSKRYWDSKAKSYFIEVAHGTKFYEEGTGHTLIVPYSDRKVRLLIISGEVDPQGDRPIVKSTYQGIAMLKGCDTQGTELESSHRSRSPVCRDARFWFVDDVLEISKEEDKCDIVAYSKMYSGCIKKSIPDFPTPQEIDEALKTTPCHIVCKALYTYWS